MAGFRGFVEAAKECLPFSRYLFSLFLMKLGICLTILLALPAVAGRRPSYESHEIDVEKELLITDPAVVDSAYAAYPGPFSFGHLIDELAGERGAKGLILDWVSLWEEDQEVNQRVVEARPAIREKLIDPWKAKDGCAGCSDDEWDIDLAHAPFRLLAIVNRLDLGTGVFIDEREKVSIVTNSQYYSSTTAEVRFVFAALKPDGSSLEGGFTMILEYGMRFQQRFRDRELPDAIFKYAAYWHELGSFTRMDQAYLKALANITSVVTQRDRERSLRGLKDPKGREIVLEMPPSAEPLLLQIRTNDGALGDVREFRQCRVSGGEMRADRLAATPAAVFLEEGSREQRSLVRYLNDNERAIKNGTHVFPFSIRGRSNRHPLRVVGGNALVTDNDPNFHWELRRVRDREVRRRISMGTCNGCHSGETGTSFFHIAPRKAGEASVLSPFLSYATGPLEVPDPANPRLSVTHDEMGQRAAIFAAVLRGDMRPSAIRRLVRDRQRRSH